MARGIVKEAAWRIILSDIREELEVTNMKIDSLAERFDAVDTHFRAVNERLDTLKEEYDLANDVSVLQEKKREQEGKLSTR